MEHFLLSALQRTRAELLAARGQHAQSEECLRQALDVAVAQGACFHALQALVSAARLNLLPAGAAQRLGALLPAYDGESIGVVQQARTLLRG